MNIHSIPSILKRHPVGPLAVIACLLGLTSYIFVENVRSLSAPEVSDTASIAAPIAEAPPSIAASSDAAIAADEAQESAAANPIIQRSVKVEKGDVLVDVLARGAVSAEEQPQVAAALTKVFNPRDLKPGQALALSFQKEDDALHLVELEMAPDLQRSISLVANDDGSFTAREIKAHLTTVTRAALATIDGSLYDAGYKAKIPPQILAAFIRAYSYSVDFQRDIQPGDKFAMMYEVTVTDKGDVVKPGNILAAFLKTGERPQRIYLNRTADGSLAFFSPDGRSIRRTLLRTPVAAVKITSGFGMRVHPLLGYSKMHKGVDFGATVGTPVFAAGDGIIDKIGWWGGYGKYIRIRHGNDMGTAYGHLSRFNPNLQEGSRVRQGQIIALSGSTGAVTGPHLHFEVLKHGMQVNPLTVTDAIGNGLSPGEMTQFKRLMDARDRQMRELIHPTEVAVRTSQPTSKIE